MASERQYDLVVHGATGYTGKEIAEHVAKAFPTNLKWAVAGRSTAKLLAVVGEIKQYNADRTPPAVEEVRLQKADLAALARKTKVLINAVGPFHLYGTPVVEACVEAGTHYLDITGEVPWVAQLTEKYHAAAQKTGAIIIPQCGVESSPPDITSYATAAHLKQHAGLDTDELVYAVHTFDGAPSGGTILTILTLFDAYGALGVQAATQPSAMTPAPLRTPVPHPKPLLQALTGIRTVPDLGLTTTNPVGATDVPVIYRSWSLLQTANRRDAYGPSFRFTPVMSARNVLLGVLTHMVAIAGGLCLALPPMRWLFARIASAPGTGPSKEREARGSLESRALAVPAGAGPRAHGRIRWDGGLYHWTAVLVGQAAATILYGGDDVPARQLGGGLLTPATLGQPYVERLQEQGTRFEFKLLSR